ncbi:hypothetical protein EYZ11_001234 [Aspergillus tanneri]|uniref:Uncharacterized protein n=1 Tax=Aspergillus tanneri TaxID=1220188 RepID=A0A4S3JV74_9EURO|nr:hypothetical protein EYZ11_001234 [Aspergillus tanneri]
MLDKLGPPFAFTLWVSARLLLVHGSTIAHNVSPDIIFFVDTLTRMGKYWKVAERYSSILRRVLDEYGEYQQSGADDSERVTPSTVKILADMRRCAFDLDFLISRQPHVFGFFNVPRVPAERAPDLNDIDVNDTVNDPMSIHGLTRSNANNYVVDGALSNANEFNITNYLIPTPETDWLFRPGA